MQTADWIKVPLGSCWQLALEGAKAQVRAVTSDPRRAENWYTWGKKGMSILAGCAGELALHRLAGLKYIPSTAPDGGMDLPGWNVRSTTYWGDPYLMDPAGREHWKKQPRFVLCAVMIPGRYVYVVGHCSTEELLSRPVRDRIRQGKRLPHPAHLMHWTELEPWRTHDLRVLRTSEAPRRDGDPAPVPELQRRAEGVGAEGSGGHEVLDVQGVRQAHPDSPEEPHGADPRAGYLRVRPV